MRIEPAKKPMIDHSLIKFQKYYGIPWNFEMTRQPATMKYCKHLKFLFPKHQVKTRISDVFLQVQFV